MPTCPKCGTRFASNVRICTHDGTVLNDEPAADAHVGKLLDGKYRLDGFLSQGGMGAVYKATHIMLDKTVVVKLIKPELVTSAEVVRRFQREARAASNLNHPNIVAVYDLGQTEDGTLYIAMEFIDGPSLKDVIRRTGPMPVPRIVAILRQVAAALAQAHGHNIIHRDLKPHNVMLAKGPGGQEVAKLLDFGIAKTFEDGSTQLTQTGFAIGTPQYMAPEQAAGKEVTAQSDLYSLGAMLYEMLIGEVPFDAPTTAAILIKQLTEQPQPPSHRKPQLNVSPALETIALRCLDKEPSRRYASAAALAEALADVDTGVAAANQSASAATRIVASPLTPEPPAPAAPSRTATTAAPPIVSAPPAPTRSVATAAAPPPAPPTAPSPVAAAPVAAPPSTAAVPPPIAAAPPSDGTRPTVAGSAMPAATPPPAPSSSSKTGLWITLGAAAVLVVAVAASQLGLIPGQGKETPAQAAQSAPAPQASPASADAPPAAAPAAATTPATPTPATSPSVATPAEAPRAEAPPPSPAAPAATASPGSSGSTAAASSRPGSAQTPASSATSAATAATSAATAAAVNAAATNATKLAVETAAAANGGKRPAASAPASAPASAASAAPAAAAAPASRPAPPVRSENPTVFLRCEGFPVVCNALRASLLEQFQKQDIQPVREPSRAAIVLTTNVEIVQERVSRDFGTPMQTRTYTVDVSGETHEGTPVSMPPPKTFSFDAQYGRERLEENVRVLASDVTDKIKAFWRK